MTCDDVFVDVGFDAERAALLAHVETGAGSAGRIRVCCVDMPPLEPQWLIRTPSTSPRIDVYQSILT